MVNGDSSDSAYGDASRQSRIDFMRQQAEEREADTSQEQQEREREEDEDVSGSIQSEQRQSRQEFMQEQAEREEADAPETEDVSVEEAPRPEGGSSAFQGGESVQEQMEQDAPELTQERETAGRIAGEVVRETGGQVRATEVDITREELTESQQQDLREEVAQEEGVDPSQVQFEGTPSEYRASVSEEGLDRLASQNRRDITNSDGLEVSAPVENQQAPTQRSATNVAESPTARDVATGAASVASFIPRAIVEGERQIQQSDTAQQFQAAEESIQLGGTTIATGGRVATGARYLTGGVGTAAAVAGVATIGANELTRDEPELPASEQQFDVDELEPTQGQFEESEIRVGDGTFTQSELAVEEQQFNVDEIGVGEQTVESEIPLGDGTQDVGQGVRDDSVVSDEYPLPGRDVPADPTREYVSGGIDTTLGTSQQIGSGLIEEGGGMFEYERRREQRRQEEELREILRGPEDEVTIGEQRRELYREGYTPFVSLRGETEPEVDVEEETMEVTETTQQTEVGVGEGPMPDILPGVDGRQATDVAAEQAQVQEFDFAQQTGVQQEYEYPTEQAYEYPNEFAYGFEFATETGTGRGGGVPPFPSLEAGGDGDEFLGLQSSAAPVLSEFGNPLGDTGRGGDTSPDADVDFFDELFGG